MTPRWRGTAITVAMVVGTVIARALDAHPAWRVLIVVCGALALLVTLIRWAGQPPTEGSPRRHDRERPVGRRWDDPVVSTDDQTPGRLTISRPATLRDHVRSYAITVNGSRHRLRSGRTLGLDVPPGEVVVSARIDWPAPAVWQGALEPGEAVDLEVGQGRSLAGLVGAGPYLTLTEVGRRSS